MATNARYLEGDGATRNEAVTAIGITSAASFAVHAVATVLVLALVHRPIGTIAPSLPAGMPWVAALLALGVIAFGIAFAPRIVRRVTAALQQAWSEVSSMCADPRRVIRLLTGTIGVTFGHGLAFVAAVTACGIHLPIAAMLAVFLAGSAVGSAAPTPGGLGALEAALVAGLTTFGAGVGPAVAGVLAYRLITYWLPILPGAIALKVLSSALRRAEAATPDRLPSSHVSPAPALLP
jgi:undecaprenyl-diphosphatase